MPDPVLPVVIRGPAIVTIGGLAIYTQGDIKRKLVRSTTPINTDMFGKIDERLASQMWDLDFTPAGEVKSLASLYPWGPSSMVAASPVGDSIFAGNCVIHTKAGQTITFPRAGISKMPTLFLSPRKTAFGAMGISVIGKAATQPNTIGYWKVIGATAFADASFDPTKIFTDNYVATLGNRAAPFDAMGARDGFELEPTLELDNVDDDGIGIADRRIVSVGWKCRFAPNNLTEAEVDGLSLLEDADAIVPGQSVARGPAAVEEDLVIEGENLTATLHQVGVTTVEGGYGVKVDRNGRVEFANKWLFAAGVPQPLISLELAA